MSRTLSLGLVPFALLGSALIFASCGTDDERNEGTEPGDCTDDADNDGDGLFDCDDGHAMSAPVASYLPNALGMYDVFGNVSEWVQDCSGHNHEGAPTDGSAHVRDDCPARVLKGGSWAGGPGFLRPAIRGGFPVSLHGDGHGLRVVREIP